MTVEDIDISINPPNLEITIDTLVGEMTAEYPLEEVIDIGEDDIEIISADEKGIVVEAEGETTHIDLSDIEESAKDSL